MEVGKVADAVAWIGVGMFLGIWFTMSAFTHDETVKRNHPCRGCSKRLKTEEEKTDG